MSNIQHELGIIDSKYAPNNKKPGPGGEIAYWHVDNVIATLEKLTVMGVR